MPFLSSRGFLRYPGERDRKGLPDAFPVAESRALVVPRRHGASLFDLTGKEQVALWRLVALVRDRLMAEVRPAGFTVGVNDPRKAFIEYWKKHNPDNKPRGFLTDDGNHWTEAGHKFVAERMLKKFP